MSKQEYISKITKLLTSMNIDRLRRIYVILKGSDEEGHADE